ncbi:isocitrate/isopropylmalate dehydrogenase family protein [Candidatus Uabimicrobium sp. HlEnr_7]|uniref:isocitrate/isopropylmalate dehydrogenase family protein n=1 Tax=Candidatus Uabimicrobium helgolandensis TaxID=3095367 RepID=UPI0035583CB7
MQKRTIVTMPGDGIGKVVLSETIRVLKAVEFEADYVHADIGWDFWCQEGNPLPQRTIDLIEKHRVGLFGAITSKPNNEAQKELAPHLQTEELTYFSPIVKLRQHFGLDICIRPCKSFRGNPLNFIRRSKEGGVDEPRVDAVIFRQNTEGLYAGVEWTNPPLSLRNELERHPRMSFFNKVPAEDLAISTRVFSRNACRRIIKQAFEYAQKYGHKSVTVCEKPNVLRETSGMLEEEAIKIAKQFPEISLYSNNIDAQMMWLTKNPEDTEVIVAGNMFGDIISDGFAGLVGGLGFACSANIGDDCAVFEPTHGSAPKYEAYGVSIVNPIAMIMSAKMMLDYLDEREKAQQIEDAIAKTISTCEVQTYDMKKMRGREDVVKNGAASTIQMVDAIIANL